MPVQSPISRRGRPSADLIGERSAALRTAIPIIAARCVSALTLAEVSVRAGLPRYRASGLFASRSAFLVQVAERIAAHFEYGLAPLTGAAALRNYAEQYCLQSRTQPEAARALYLILSEGAVDRDLRDGLAPLNARKMRRLQTLFVQAQACGEIASQDPHGDACLLLASLRGLVASWLAVGDDQALAAGHDQLQRRFLA